MTVGYDSPDDIVNAALRMIGYPRRIGTIWEGSAAAVAALDLYAQTRDELLRSKDWPFARRANVVLARLKGPPPPGGYNPMQPWSALYPAPGWLYEYAYPADCLEMRSLSGTPAELPELDPKPARWRIDNDNSASPARKVILANIAGAVASYRGQVVDVTTWEPGFTATIVSALADKLRRALTEPNGQERQEAMGETAAIAAVADKHRG